MGHTGRALVLGGGGFAASAWQIGLISGMADAGLDLRSSDLFIGTSAGARVALAMASSLDLEKLFQQQFEPPPASVSMPTSVDWPKVRAEYDRIKAGGGETNAILRRLGELALAITPADTGNRRKIVASQLPVQDWPAKRLLIVTVDAKTGERRAFDRGSGVALVDAMVATTAFFGWPGAMIDGHLHIDGGFYSSSNSDLAVGFEKVTVLAPHAPAQSMAFVSLEQCVNNLRAAGSQVEVIHPDQACLSAFASVGSGMSPVVRGPAAKAGRAQGQRIVEYGEMHL